MEEVKLAMPEEKAVTPQIILPTAKAPVLSQSPNRTLIYSPPKAGKTLR